MRVAVGAHLSAYSLVTSRSHTTYLLACSVLK